MTKEYLLSLRGMREQLREMRERAERLHDEAISLPPAWNAGKITVKQCRILIHDKMLESIDTEQRLEDLQIEYDRRKLDILQAVNSLTDQEQRQAAYWHIVELKSLEEAARIMGTDARRLQGVYSAALDALTTTPTNPDSTRLDSDKL